MNTNPDGFITTSVFDIFKIGPGPSSSHTIGPMKAAARFRDLIAGLPAGVRARADRVTVDLFGSLSDTGRGHGTDRAVAAGLLGMRPETCDCDELARLLHPADAVHRVVFDAGGPGINLRADDIRFAGACPPGAPHPNTLVLRLMAGADALLERECYSIGGGFVVFKDEPAAPRPAPPHPFRDMRQLKAVLTETGMPLVDLMLEHERAMTFEPHVPAE